MAAATWSAHSPSTRQSGKLTLLNQIDCQGNNPVDSALDPTERFLVIANYGTGAVAVMPVGDDGRLQPVSQLVPLPGTPGPNPKEQASSHPHAVIFDPTGQFVIVPDKGFDRTFFFRFQGGRLAPTEQGSVASAPARRRAMRHSTRRCRCCYVNNELDSTVTVFDWAGGRATERQVISTVPSGHAGHNTRRRSRRRHVAGTCMSRIAVRTASCGSWSRRTPDC